MRLIKECFSEKGELNWNWKMGKPRKAFILNRVISYEAVESVFKEERKEHLSLSSNTSANLGVVRVWNSFIIQLPTLFSLSVAPSVPSQMLPETKSSLSVRSHIPVTGCSLPISNCTWTMYPVGKASYLLSTSFGPIVGRAFHILCLARIPHSRREGSGHMIQHQYLSSIM